MDAQKCVFKNVCNKAPDGCSDSCLRYIQFNRLLELSNLPKSLQSPIKLYEVEADKLAYKRLNDIRKDITNFVKDGKCLYICSNICGNAKTSWAAKLMLRYFYENWKNSYDVTKGLFVHIPTLLIDLKNFSNPPEYLDRIKDAELVIFDDLAATNRLTDFEHEQLLQFIDYRISNNLSCIFTSNITNYELLKQIYGGRLASRVFNGSEVVTFYSNDFRVCRS